MVSIREVAKEAGVSTGTVSRYLNGEKLKSTNMAKIKAAIKKFDYHENLNAKGLRNARTLTVGLLINHMNSRFSMEFVAQLERDLSTHGYNLLVSGFEDDAETLASKILRLAQRSVDGLIVFEASGDWATLPALSDLAVPVLSVNAPNELVGVDSLLTDDRRSVFDVLSRFVEDGHKHIGVITAPQRDFSARERLAGVLDARSAHPDVEFELFEGDYSRLSGYSGASYLSEKGVTALFVCNYNMALGARQWLSVNRRFEDASLAFGAFEYDDGLTTVLASPYTVVQPASYMGSYAADRLLKRMNSAFEDAGATFVFHNDVGRVTRRETPVEVITKKEEEK